MVLLVGHAQTHVHTYMTCEGMPMRSHKHAHVTYDM